MPGDLEQVTGSSEPQFPHLQFWLMLLTLKLVPASHCSEVPSLQAAPQDIPMMLWGWKAAHILFGWAPKTRHGALRRF